MRIAILVGIICLARAGAQPVVAPTPVQPGSPRGENSGDYNITDSFETGYRFAVVDGSLGTYRSDVNFGDGIRLLGSNLTINSRDGHGRWFDQIVLTTTGLGNDPYESATLRVEKNKLYRYDLLWRMDDYYNPGLPLAAGLHLMDTTRTMQDHDLTILPESRIRFHFGYSRNLQDGPALSSVQLFDNTGSEFPLFTNVHRLDNQFRLGADVDFAGFRLTVTHLWNDFREDTNYQENGATSGDNPAAGVTLNQFTRTEPYHGTNPAWMGNLTRSSQTWAMNARATYVAGHRDYILDQNAVGVTPLGAQTQQILVSGDAARPSLTGDLSLSWFPIDRLTVTNNSSYTNTRIDGNSVFEQYDNATESLLSIPFRYLGIRLFDNSTDLHYRVRKWFSVYTGYHYTTRRIKYIESDSGQFPFSASYTPQENHLNAVLVGVRVKPVAPMTISLETEIGRLSEPFTPISDKKYQALGGRFEYRIRNLVFNASYKENYNENSVTVSSYSSRSRNYGAGATWTPRGWFALDASYSKLHLDTVAGIEFFSGLPEPDAVYISNIHAGNLMAHFTIRKRFDLSAGYTITKDVGDGRNSAIPPGITDPIALVFAPFQTFPLTYQSPQARLSIRLNPKLRWNAGWQFYNYHEEFGLFSFYQGYHANTGYTSVSWAF